MTQPLPHAVHALLADPALNLRLGWLLVLAGFLSGAALGLGFHRADFLGGYGSLRRRLARLGHIACVALGLLNVLLASTPFEPSALARVGLALGGLSMPLVCFLAAWRPRLRQLFPLPVALLVAGALGAFLSTFGASS